MNSFHDSVKAKMPAEIPRRQWQDDLVRIESGGAVDKAHYRSKGIERK